MSEKVTLIEHPDISLNNIIGILNLNTLRVKGKVACHWISILVDTRSIHSFVDLAIVKRAQILVDTKKIVKVKVANGDMIVSEEKVNGLRVSIQGLVFTTEAYVLVLEGCDVVMEINLLQNKFVVES